MGLNWMGKLNAKELNEKKNTIATTNNININIICCAERESKFWRLQYYSYKTVLK